MPSLTWNDIPLRRWAAAGLCTESYEEWRVYPTPQAAYAACASPSDLIRVVFGVLPRNEAVGVLCGVIRPVIAPHAPSASMDALTIIERWSAGTATDEEMRAAAARAAEAWAATGAAWAAEAAWAAAAAEARAAAAARAAWAAEARAAANQQMCATIREHTPWSRIAAAIVTKYQIEEIPHA